jgi:hypothetical protein
LGLALDGKVYIGFVIANVSATAKFDDLQLEFDGSSSIPSQPCSYYFGFPNANPNPPPEPPDPDTEFGPWTSAYLALDEATDLNKAVNRFFFHVNDGSVEIRKVLVNTTKSTMGAVTVLDFTRNDGPNAAY